MKEGIGVCFHWTLQFQDVLDSMFVSQVTESLMLRLIKQDADLLFEKQKIQQDSEPRCLLAIAAVTMSQTRLYRSLTLMILAPKGERTITIMLRITK